MAASPIGVPVDLVVVTAPARPGWGTTLGRFIHRKPLGAAGGAIMLVMLVTAVLAPWLQTHDPIATDAAYTLGRPSAEHWLGTDHLGRDIYSRIVHGAWVSLVVGTGSTLLGSVLGGIIGLLSAYVAGKTDLITQRLLDILQGLPLLVLALVMSASLGSAILVEATLWFLGMGIPEPYPSWGRMLSVSAAEYAQKAPHLVLFPGIAISLAVFGSNLLGDALRDTLDPRLRGSR